MGPDIETRMSTSSDRGGVQPLVPARAAQHGERAAGQIDRGDLPAVDGDPDVRKPRSGPCPAASGILVETLVVVVVGDGPGVIAVAELDLEVGRQGLGPVHPEGVVRSA